MPRMVRATWRAASRFESDSRDVFFNADRVLAVFEDSAGGTAICFDFDVGHERRIAVEESVEEIVAMLTGDDGIGDRTAHGAHYITRRAEEPPPRRPSRRL